MHCDGRGKASSVNRRMLEGNIACQGQRQRLNSLTVLALPFGLFINVKGQALRDMADVGVTGEPFNSTTLLDAHVFQAFFKGTSADQDRRFSDKELKLLKTMKFPPEFDKKVGNLVVKRRLFLS